ncbi:MAG: hypothetical protein ACPG49_04525 [Chitinophagales bacterium]
MKQLLKIAFLLAFIITQTTYGQTSIGISAGFNFSNNEFKNLNYITPKARKGFFIGVSPSISLSKKINFVLNTQYSQDEYLYISNCLACNSIDLEYRNHYIDIMPEIEYKVLNFLIAGVGFNYGFLIDEDVKTGYDEWSDIEDISEKNNFGLTGKLKVMYKNFFGLVRYNLGLKNIMNQHFSNGEGDQFVDVKEYSRNLQVGVGYAFNVKKK